MRSQLFFTIPGAMLVRGRRLLDDRSAAELSYKVVGIFFT
jgi:hypothetical protein